MKSMVSNESRKDGEPLEQGYSIRNPAGPDFSETNRQDVTAILALWVVCCKAMDSVPFIVSSIVRN